MDLSNNPFDPHTNGDVKPIVTAPGANNTNSPANPQPSSSAPSSSAAAPPPHDPERSTGPIMVCAYNYKGGVAKTTTIHNLGATFAAAGKRVLFVDADPQCNLSSFLLPILDDDSPDAADGPPDAEETKDVGDIFMDGCDNFSDIVRQRGDFVDNKNTIGWENNLHDMLVSYIRPTPGARLELPELKPIQENMYLIPGSPTVIELEHAMSNLTLFNPIGDPITGLGAFRYVVRGIAARHSIDVILVDFGPSTGVINKVFVMSCDYILPLAMADRFSYESSKGFVNSVLPNWWSWYETALVNQKRGMAEYRDQAVAAEREKYCLPLHPPTVLPLIITGYKTKLLDGILKALSGFQASLTRAPSYVDFTFCKWIKSLSTVVDDIPPSHFTMFPGFQYRIVALLLQIPAAMANAHQSRKAVVQMPIPKRKDHDVIPIPERHIRIAIQRYRGLANAIWKLRHPNDNTFVDPPPPPPPFPLPPRRAKRARADTNNEDNDLEPSLKKPKEN